MEIIQYLIGIPLLALMGLFAWQSAMLVDDKKQRRHQGLTDYYDNPIGKNNE